MKSQRYDFYFNNRVNQYFKERFFLQDCRICRIYKLLPVNPENSVNPAKFLACKGKTLIGAKKAFFHGQATSQAVIFGKITVFSL
jgi:hypothetical protein